MSNTTTGWIAGGTLFASGLGLKLFGGAITERWFGPRSGDSGATDP